MSGPRESTLASIPHYLSVYQGFLGARMYLIFGLTLLATLSEGFGIMMVMPLLDGLAGPEDQADSPVGQLLQSLLTALGWSNSTPALLLLITIAFVLKGALIFASLGYAAVLRTRLLRELKMRMFEDISATTLDYYTRRSTGHFMNVVNGQIENMLGAFEALASVLSQCISTLVYLGLALVVAWKFGLMALVCGMTFLILLGVMNGYVRRISRATASEAGELSRLLVQALQAFKYLKATEQIPAVRQHIRESVDRLAGYRLRQGLAMTFVSAIREPVAVVLVALLVMVQVVYFHAALAPMMVAIVLFYRALSSTLGLQSGWQSVMGKIGATELVRDEFGMLADHREATSARALGPLASGIRFDDVHFRYNADGPDVVAGLDLEIPARKSVALVGASGAGKSTIVDLVSLTLRPQRGRILIDGVEHNELDLATWRRQIGYVSQDTVVFDDSISNNISMWSASIDDVAAMDRVRAAARAANIASLIESLPDGYETQIGERGVRLSGGQRQRLFIARELFRRPSLLILDEATSALDSESEKYVQESIDALHGTTTVVIVAHRLSTIRNVDCIHVLERGRVIESGPFEELRSASGSRFSGLVNLQAL